jgi:hypothetical protein
VEYGRLKLMILDFRNRLATAQKWLSVPLLHFAGEAPAAHIDIVLGQHPGAMVKGQDPTQPAGTRHVQDKVRRSHSPKLGNATEKCMYVLQCRSERGAQRLCITRGDVLYAESAARRYGSVCRAIY